MHCQRYEAWKGVVALLLVIIFSMAGPDSWGYAVLVGILGVILARFGFSIYRISYFWKGEE